MTDENYSGESGRRADASKIIQAIDRVRKKHGVQTTGENNRSLDWDNPRDRTLVRERFDDASGEAILPGFGPEGLGGNARDDCGNPHPFICNECGHSVEFGRTCSQSVCARCGVAWVRDLGIKKSAKVRRIRKEKNQNTSPAEHQYIHHQVISLPLTWYFDLANAGYSLEEAQDVTKSVVKEILDEMRAQGVVVRHSYRGKNPDGTVKSESDDRGAWKERLNSDRAWFGDVRDDLAWMPHYHCIVVSDFLKGGKTKDEDDDEPGLSEKVEEATGWVIHRIAGDDGVSLRDDGAMARALTYCLSHADIDVREDAYNQSCVWEVGSFQGDPIRSSGRFSAWDSDLEWADACVRRLAKRILGIRNGTSDCGAIIPGVDDPGELARRIILELYPEEDDRPDVDSDTVLHHVAQGNIDVSVSTTSGGGGNVTVNSAFGQSHDGGWGGFSGATWSAPSGGSFDGDAGGVRALPLDQDDQGDDCDGSCGGDHDTDATGLKSSSSSETESDGRDEDSQCDGRLIPLGEARHQGLLDDDRWCRDAVHVDEAREADREWPEDLDPWRTSNPDPVKSISIG